MELAELTVRGFTEEIASASPAPGGGSAAALAGAVGAGGIGAPLIFAMNHYKWSEAGAIALGLILLVWCIDRLSASLRR